MFWLLANKYFQSANLWFAMHENELCLLLGCNVFLTKCNNWIINQVNCVLIAEIYLFLISNRGTKVYAHEWPQSLTLNMDGANSLLTAYKYNHSYPIIGFRDLIMHQSSSIPLWHVLNHIINKHANQIKNVKYIIYKSATLGV